MPVISATRVAWASTKTDQQRFLLAGGGIARRHVLGRVDDLQICQVRSVQRAPPRRRLLHGFPAACRGSGPRRRWRSRSAAHSPSSRRVQSAPTETPICCRARPASNSIAATSDRAGRRPRPQVPRFRAQWRQPPVSIEVAVFQQPVFWSAGSDPAPRRGWNARCRSPAPKRSKKATSFRRRAHEQANPSRASAIRNGAGDRQRPPRRSPARGRCARGGVRMRRRRGARRCRCRALQGRVRLPPRRTRPRSRRPGYPQRHRAWRGASRVRGDRNEIASRQLVLPAPLGPTSTTTSPRVSTLAAR